MKSKCQERLDNILIGFQECQKLLVAIGDETRILILLALLESDLSGMRVGEISNKVHLTRPSVSHHLKMLKEAGIVSVRKEKTMNFYYMNLEETQWRKMLEFVSLIYEGVHDRCDLVRQRREIE